MLVVACGRLHFEQAEADGQMSSDAMTLGDAQENFCNRVTTIPLVECQALVAIYRTTAGDNWLNNTGWLVGTDPCTWFGIMCAGGSVVSVDLRSNQLAGSIPPEVGNLAALQHLEIDSNQLVGAIPPSFGQLAQLQELSLKENQLTGQIPIELTTLSNLQRLRISYNGLSGPLPGEIGEMSGLTELTADGNAFGPNIPASIGNLSGLTELQLSKNQFSGEVPSSLMNIQGPVFPSFSLRGQTGCLTTPDSALAAWLTSRDAAWNDGCL